MRGDEMREVVRFPRRVRGPVGPCSGEPYRRVEIHGDGRTYGGGRLLKVVPESRWREFELIDRGTASEDS